METKSLCLALVLVLSILKHATCQDSPTSMVYSRPAFTYTMGNEVIQACSDVLRNAMFHTGECPNSPYPANTSLLTLRGRWWNTAKNPDDEEESTLISGQLGTFDFWEQHDAPTSHKAWQNLTGMLYLMRRSGNKAEDYQHFVTVQAEGVYIPCLGIVCMIGCYNKQEIEAIPDEMMPGEAVEGVETPTDEAAWIDEEKPPVAQEEAWTTTTTAAAPPTVVDISDENEGFAFPALDTTWKMDTSGDCSVRIVLQLGKTASKKAGARVNLNGSISSILPANETGYFEKLDISGHSLNTQAEADWYWFEIFAAVAFLVAGLLCTVRQILWTRICAAGQYTSLFMVAIQLGVGLYIWGRELYWPLRFMALDVLWYQFTSFAAVPRFVSLAIIIAQLTLILSIRRRRRVARADYADPKLAPTETPVMLSCLPLYILAAGLFWLGQDLETFLKVAQYLHLTPQIVSNIAWDTAPGPRPIHPVYSVGLSLVQILNLTFDTYRPAFLGYVGYDDLYDFPHAWFATVVLLIASQAVLLVLQQAFGGRALVPSKYRGYLPVGKDDAGDEPAIRPIQTHPNLAQRLGSIKRILLDGEDPESAPSTPGSSRGTYRPPSMLSRLSSAKRLLFDQGGEGMGTPRSLLNTPKSMLGTPRGGENLDNIP